MVGVAKGGPDRVPPPGRGRPREPGSPVGAKMINQFDQDDLYVEMTSCGRSKSTAWVYEPPGASTSPTPSSGTPTRPGGNCCAKGSPRRIRDIPR